MKGVAEDAYSYFDDPASAWGGEKSKHDLIHAPPFEPLWLFVSAQQLDKQFCPGVKTSRPLDLFPGGRAGRTRKQLIR